MRRIPKPPSRRYAVKKLNKVELTELVKESRWEQDPDPLSKLQEVIKEGLERYCPRAKPYELPNHRWSPRAKELLIGARRARRAYLSEPRLHHKQSMKSHQNLLKKELKRGSRAAWRRFIKDITTNKKQLHNKGL